MTNGAYQFALVRLGPDELSTQIASRFLSLGITPGPLLAAALEGARPSITAQIAVKMGLDAALERALEIPETHDVPLASNLVRESFKEANTRVYQYGHRMGAGGTMQAVGMLAALAHDRFTIGRVGPYEGYLFRGAALMPLFEPAEKAAQSGVLTRFIGANAQILVDLSSLEVLQGDVLAVAKTTDRGALEDALKTALPKQSPLQHRALEAARILEKTPAPPPLLMLLQIGRPTITLSEVVK